jgi:hypothetical protein
MNTSVLLIEPAFLLSDWLLTDSPIPEPAVKELPAVPFKQYIVEPPKKNTEQDKSALPELRTEKTDTKPLEIETFNPWLIQWQTTPTPELKPIDNIPLVQSVQSTTQIDQIQQIQQQLRSAIQLNGSINVSINPQTHVVLTFNQKKVSATYTTSELATVQQLAQQVQITKQSNVNNQWPIETIEIKYEKPAKQQQKKRQK